LLLVALLHLSAITARKELVVEREHFQQAHRLREQVDRLFARATRRTSREA